MSDVTSVQSCMSEGSRSSNKLIKLKINKSETVRRIPVHRLNEEEGVSFEKLRKYIVRYSQNNEEEVVVKITYRDEDGDDVEVSSCEELQDALILCSVSTLQLHASVLSKKILVQRKLERRSTEVLNAFGSVLNFVCDTVDTIAGGLIPYPVTESSSVFDLSFTHGRHTCDECGICPIIGYRWHAVNVWNYDLCNRCKITRKVDGNRDILFKLAQVEADRNLKKFTMKKNVLQTQNQETQTQHPSQTNSTNTDIDSLSSLTATQDFENKNNDSQKADDVIVIENNTPKQSSVTASKETLNKEKNTKEEEEWDLIGQGETDFEAIGSSLFRQGLM